MRLLHQILLATLLTILPVIGLVGITMYSSVRRGVWHYIHQIEVQRVTPVVERLAQEHHQRGDWEFPRGEDLLWSHLLRPADPPGVSHPPLTARRPPGSAGSPLRAAGAPSPLRVVVVQVSCGCG